MGTKSLACVCRRSPSRSQPTLDGIFAILPPGLPTNGSRSSGSYLPFAKTAVERERSGDLRKSIAERCLGREDYLNRSAGQWMN